MVDPKNTIRTNFKNLSGAGDDKKGNWQKSGHPEKLFRYFGIESGNRFVRRFKIILRDGRVVSIPYAYLPIIIFDPNADLKIKTNDMEITIEGRSLNKLADWISEEKVTWIKESSSGVDDEECEVFISAIRVEGDLII